VKICDNFLDKIVIATALVDLLKIIFTEHARNLSAAEKIVDVFEEGLINHMILREHEIYLTVLEHSTLHDLENILSELEFTIIFANLNLL
jgi:hypothetical protein